MMSFSLLIFLLLLSVFGDFPGKSWQAHYSRRNWSPHREAGKCFEGTLTQSWTKPFHFFQSINNLIGNWCGSSSNLSRELFETWKRCGKISTELLLWWSKSKVCFKCYLDTFSLSKMLSLNLWVFGESRCFKR